MHYHHALLLKQTTTSTDMGHMKYLHQLMESKRIEELDMACKEAIDKGEDMFIFDGSYLSIKYAQNLINYASKNPLRIHD